MTGKTNVKKDEAEIKKKKKFIKKKEKKSKEKRPLLYDPWKILIAPHLSEKNIGLVESENKLVFIVNEKSNKKQIKWAVEKLFDVKVEKVNILNDTKNRKKAFIKLSAEYVALDIATKLGML
ncbi:MAG: 50S ribosomal protein L23 [Candidatus Aenigmarchaeota archaeon]|nr:50S ribosomal protein L23 [Candidatus Aenigmarchaeota archaeon]